MGSATTGRTEVARVFGLAHKQLYPAARVDLEYRTIDEEGRTDGPLHTLKVVVSSDEARQIAKAFLDAAASLEGAGGTKQ